jgi:hypothetical protein
MQKVTIPALREMARVLLDHLQETKGNEIILENDYYWSIPPEEAFRLDATPEVVSLTVGRLTDNLENLQSMVDSDEPLNFGLNWLGDVLKAIGMQSNEIQIAEESH